MKGKKIILAAITATSLSGCGTVNIRENLVTLDQGYFVDTQAIGTPGFLTTKAQEYPALLSAYAQIHGKSPHAFVPMRDANILPKFMLNESLVKKIVDASYSSLIEGKEASIDITTGDIKGFVSMTSKNYGAESITKDSSNIHEIIKKYLITYYSDTKKGFIDREGTVYKRPDIKTSIGNDIITTVALVALEGLFDGILNVPVYTDKDNKYLTAKGAEPTVHKLKFADSEKIVPKGDVGISELELKAIRYLSGLASDQSKALSGLAIRTFGDLEIGFVIGGHFSFGDNDTLAKLLDTTFEISSKRIVEAGAYNGFRKLTWGTNAFSIAENQQSGAIELLNDLGDM